jgi:hypothetical protein
MRQSERPGWCRRPMWMTRRRWLKPRKACSSALCCSFTVACAYHSTGRRKGASARQAGQFPLASDRRSSFFPKNACRGSIRPTMGLAERPASSLGRTGRSGATRSEQRARPFHPRTGRALAERQRLGARISCRKSETRLSSPHEQSCVSAPPQPRAVAPGASSPGAQGAMKQLPRFMPRNPLKNLDSDERIQGNPRKSNPHNRGFSEPKGHPPRKPKSTG